jgi:hypothetical protein
MMSASVPAPTAVLRVQAGQPLLVETFAEWREAARDLLIWGVPPEAITWSTAQAGGDLFTSAPAAADEATRQPTCRSWRRPLPGRRTCRAR